MGQQIEAYLELGYLVKVLVPAETACLAYSPGSRSLIEVWISPFEIVDCLLYWESWLVAMATSLLQWSS